MTNLTKMTLLSTALAAFLLPAMSQTSNPPASTNAPATANTPATANAPATTSSPTPESTNRVNQRANNQQERIANGIKDGELTPSEATALTAKESQINTEEQQMKNADHGQLTAADRAKLQQQQNQASQQIYKDAHNGTTQNYGSGKIGQREENQQDRIAQGMQSGQLTGGEAGNLEKQEADINHEAQKDRAANGGKLTAAEKAKIHKQQNHLSSEIYKDKHNNKVRK
jgi:hypothetical protein